MAAAGLGFLIALYRGIRFASDAAVFTTAFSHRGLMAEDGNGWMLPRLVGLHPYHLRTGWPPGGGDVVAPTPAWPGPRARARMRSPPM